MTMDALSARQMLSPFQRTRQWMQVRAHCMPTIARLRLFVLLALSLLTSGCTAFSAKRGAMADYEDAKRSIENTTYADDLTRPEGVTAEKEAFGKRFLERIGLAAKRRRNIELARSEYAAGQELFEKAKGLEDDERRETFRQAAKKYMSAAKNWQSSALEQDALLMAGESYFFAEDFTRSEDAYARLVKEYPRNPHMDHIDTRRFEIADYWLKVDSVERKPFVMVNFTEKKLPINDTGGHGRRVLEKMRLDNPTGRVSDDATMRLAVDQFEKGKYEGAADTFSDLRTTYPDSEHQFLAQFLELQSLLNSYQGHEYSSVPLDDAEKRVKAIAKQFPREAAEKQEDLNLAYGKIRFAKAERVWYQAEWRRIRSESGAARFHYQRIIDEYSDTPFAKDAEAKLEQIKDLPDDPPQRFKPLVKLFGEPKSERPLIESGSSK